MLSVGTFTHADIARFVHDGYLVVGGLVGPEDVERARADVVKFASGAYPVANAPTFPSDATPEERAAAILAIHFPHWVSDVALDLVRHTGIAAVVSAIAGAHLAHWDGAVKCMQSMLFLKPPGLQGQAWHQDERYIPTRDRSLIGAWIALDDANVENGCLWVLPGSHRRGSLWPTRSHGKPEEFDPSDEAFGFDDADAVPVEVKAGDVVFFNGYLLHRSLLNRSPRTRRALVNHYMSAASNLPWMMSKGINVATEDYRTVVMVSGDDPGAWKGYTDPPSKTFIRPHTGSFTPDDVVRAETSVRAHSIQIVIDCREPHTLADWWAETLGWSVEPQDAAFIQSMIDQGHASTADTAMHLGRLVWRDAVAVNAASDSATPGVRIYFQGVPEAKAGKNRLHLDIRPADGDPEVLRARLVERGATIVSTGRHGAHAWTTLADPEGNEFCV